MTTHRPRFRLSPEMEKAREKAEEVKRYPDSVRLWPAFVIALMVLGFIVLAVI